MSLEEIIEYVRVAALLCHDTFCPSAANRTGSPQTDITLTKIRSGGVMTQQEFLSRRQTLLAQMQPGSAALIFAAPEAVRSADSEYPYRQNSDFWYFTGFNEPEALLVLIKKAMKPTTIACCSTGFAI